MSRCGCSRNRRTNIGRRRIGHFNVLLLLSLLTRFFQFNLSGIHHVYVAIGLHRLFALLLFLFCSLHFVVDATAAD
jgi:hypothetical protein